MPSTTTRSAALLLVLPAVVLAMAAVAAPPSARKPRASSPPAVSEWTTIDRLVDEQKLEEAFRAVSARLAAARTAGDEDEWTRALVRAVQLRTALHGYETSVRFLKDEAWPKGPLQRTVLQLFYARSLVDYAHAYSWEIRQRERVETAGPVDLKAWTLDQIAEEALRAYDAVWRDREALGTLPLGRLSTYLTPGNYPEDVRGTLRDAVSYLLVELLADSSLWRPEQASSVYQLELPSLLGQGGPPPALTDAAVHPLLKIVAVLRDLEGWHAAAGRRAAELEAWLERVRRLRASFSEPADRERIRTTLEKSLPPFRPVAWWAVGMAELAEIARLAADAADGAPDALVLARRIAEQGRQAYPDSIGGARCLSIVKSIEAPDFQIGSMRLDAARKRSVRVTHRNLGALFFRAWRRDVLRTVEAARDYDLLGNQRDYQATLSQRPDAEWSVALPATPDYRSHVTYVVPPLGRPGLYTIAASARQDFGDSGNRVVATALVVSDMVVLTRPRPKGVEITVVRGATGAPIPDAEVVLYKLDWQKGHRRHAAAQSDAQGVAVFDVSEQGYFVVARQGVDVSVDTNVLWLNHDEREPTQSASLVYTDRSIYRPLQTIHWKVVAYQGSSEAARYATSPKASVSVSLVDPNNQTVESRTVTTNSYGSASGEFTVPAGRVLGAWWIRTSPDGQAVVRVEEYKRPTFEATLDEPEAALRLNRKAQLVGHARYYFGLPVTAGSVRWRVVREPVWPWWWGRWFWEGGGSGATRSETVASGSAALDQEGRFRLEFTPLADERKPKEVTYRYSVSADVTDDGGETRSVTRAYRLGFVAVEATLSSETSFLREGEEAKLVVRRVDLDGAPRQGEGRWQLLALEQPQQTLAPADEPLPRAQQQAYATDGDRLRPRSAPGYAPEAVLASWKDAPLQQQGTLEHAANGEATLRLRGLAPGAYRLRYETKDDFGAVFSMTKELLVTGGEKARFALPALLLAERSSVPVGGTARLLALSGYPDARLVVDIEKSGRRVARHVLSKADRGLIEVPITDADRGGFGVTLTAVLDHQLVTLTQQVFVPWDDRQLALSFESFRDRLRPGRRETWRVKVRTADGTPPEAGAAELLAYMYDRSLDVFAPHMPPSILSLYPNRTGSSWVRASLGESRIFHLFERDFANVPSAPSLVGTRLKQDDRYGIGGMGVRQRRRFAGDLPMPAARAMAPAPAMVADALELKAQSIDRAEAVGEARNNYGAEFGAASGNKVALEKHGAAAPPPVEMRSEFSETAFWEPQLLTAADGSATIEFKVPDSVTSWNVWVHAVTRDLRGGSLQKETRSVKELMVRPYVPRFLREGDRAQLKVVVNNAAERPLSGSLVFDIVDPASEKSVLAEFGLAGEASRPFTVKAGGSADLVFEVVTPARVGTVAFKVVARAEDLSDGELRPLPILPGRMHLALSRFVTLRPGKPRTMSFPDLAQADDPSRINEQMVVTVDAQLFYGLLQALPYLVDYPYECTEQTLNRFLSTAILSGMFQKHPAVARMAAEMAKRDTRLETWAETDPNRKMALEETPWLQEAKGGADPGAPLVKVLDPRIAKAQRESALARLQKAQTSLGAFPWFPGGPPSPYMTIYVLYGFAKGLEFDVQAPKDTVVRAWSYLHRHYLDEVARQMRKDDCCWELVTFLGYVLSSYKDASWTGGVFTEAERKEMLDFSFRHWKQHSPYLKGMLALALARAGRTANARLVFDSVMDSAKTDEDLGTWWAPEDRAWLWYNDTIETQAFALRVLSELRPDDPRREGLIQWLFLNKKLSHWKSTRATAEVIYSVAHALERQGALAAREEVRIAAGSEQARFVFEPDRYTGKNAQLVIPGEKVDAATATVRAEKDGPGLAFASATWHFSTEKLPSEDRGDLLSVSRRYFRRESRHGEWVLAPLAEGQALAPGDEVEVQLSIRAKHAAEYVHLRDPRAAGLEPGIAVSRFKWDLGIGWYEEVRDSGTNFFFEWLPAGEYTFKYRLRANMAGRFRVSPATLQSMYAPEFTAYSTGAVIEVASSR